MRYHHVHELPSQVSRSVSLAASVGLLCLSHSLTAQGSDATAPNIDDKEAIIAAADTQIQHEARNDSLNAISDATEPAQGVRLPAQTQQLAQNMLPPLPERDAEKKEEKAWVSRERKAFDSLGFDFSVKAQSYTGRFDWSIASDMTGTRTPTILSELTYDALDINVLTYDYAKRFYLTENLAGALEISYSQGNIDEGTVYDADYFGNGKTNPKSLSQSDPAGSDLSAQQVTVSLSRRLTDNTQIALLGGYAQNHQEFIKRQGVQMFSARGANVPTAGTTFSNLNSSYTTTWKSGFLGTELTHAFGAHRLKLRAEFHGADYYAEANWNLRQAFQHPKSFEHLAGGKGLNTKLTYDIALDKNLLLSFTAHREKWQTQNGIDRVFLASGQTVTTRLIETNWTRTGYGIGITYVGGL